MNKSGEKIFTKRFICRGRFRQDGGGFGPQVVVFAFRKFDLELRRGEDSIS